MSLIITLTPDAEANLQATAREKGIAPEELATQTLLERFEKASLPSTSGRTPVASLPTEITGASGQPDTEAQAALDVEITTLEAALPSEWREYIGKFDSRVPPTDEQRLEREKIREKAGAFGEIVDEKYRKQGFKV